MSSGPAHNLVPAPALCTTDVQGICIPNAVQYIPRGPPCSQITCGCGDMKCSANRYNEEGLCPGYHCESLGGAPLKMDYVDYGGQIRMPWMQCRPGSILDPSNNTCVPDPRIQPFRPWSWQAGLPDFRHF